MVWLTGWNYRKAVTLSRASGAVTNYQMKLLVGESSGATGEDVDCGGLCKSDFSDLRFTTSDGATLLDYWIESITGTTPNQLATVWIEFDSIGTGATTFYMYYGNAAATAVSSGANTFITFDDFERGNDGDTVGGSWTEIAAHVHISTEQDIGNVSGFFGTRAMKMVGAVTAPNCSIPVSASSDISIRCRFYKENASIFDMYHGDGTTLAAFEFDAAENILVYNGATWVDTAANCLADTWGLLELNKFNWIAMTCDVWYNGIKISAGADISLASALYSGALGVFGPGVENHDVWIDDFIVRHFRTPEPAWGSWGSQQNNYSPFPFPRLS